MTNRTAPLPVTDAATLPTSAASSDPWSSTDLELPVDDRSRIRTPATAGDAPIDEDIVTTEQRLRKFRQKHKTGVIQSSVDFDKELEGFTATVRVWKDKPEHPGIIPDVVANATRTYMETDQITATRPQEAAETAAIGRALRFLGIEPTRPRKTPPA